MDTISTAARDEYQARIDGGEALTEDEWADVNEYDEMARRESLADCLSDR